MNFTNSYTTLARCVALLVSICLISGCTDLPKVVPDTIEEPTYSIPYPTVSEQPHVSKLNIPIADNPTNYHPLSVKDESTLNVLSLIFEPAIKMDSTCRFLPSVVESWKVDSSEKIFTFKVREGVRFHSGGYVTADDLLFCIEKIKELSPDECVYSEYKDIIETVEVLDDLTLVVTTTQPTSDIFYLMGFPVIARDRYSGYSIESVQTPIGTGPYKVSYMSSTGLSLTINADWWRTPPVFSDIEAHPMSNEEEKIAAHQLGVLNCTPTSAMTANSYRAEGKTIVHSTVTPYYDCLVPNLSDYILRDVDVRRAISAAIDRREVIMNGVFGEGLATQTPLRPDLWYLEETELTSFNYNEAARILDEAGYKLNTYTQKRREKQSFMDIKFELMYSKEQTYKKGVAEIIKNQLEVVGLTVELVEKTPSEFKKALEEGNFDLALCTYYTKTNNDISFMLEDDLNYGGFLSTKINDLITQTRSTHQDEKLKQAYLSLEQALREELPSIGLYFLEHAILMDSLIKNVGKTRFRWVFSDVSDWR